jgi:hypothetical protein
MRNARDPLYSVVASIKGRSVASIIGGFATTFIVGLSASGMGCNMPDDY